MRLRIIGLLVTFGICLLWVPTVSHAQPLAKIPRIGMLLGGSPDWTLTAAGGQGAWLRSALDLPSPCTCSAHPGFVHPTVTLRAQGRTVPSLIGRAPV
jgi:hypothetical protein